MGQNDTLLDKVIKVTKQKEKTNKTASVLLLGIFGFVIILLISLEQYIYKKPAKKPIDKSNVFELYGANITKSDHHKIAVESHQYFGASSENITHEELHWDTDYLKPAFEHVKQIFNENQYSKINAKLRNLNNLNEDSFLPHHLKNSDVKILVNLLDNVNKKYGLLKVDETFNNLYNALQYNKTNELDPRNGQLFHEGGYLDYNTLMINDYYNYKSFVPSTGINNKNYWHLSETCTIRKRCQVFSHFYRILSVFHNMKEHEELNCNTNILEYLYKMEKCSYEIEHLMIKNRNFSEEGYVICNDKINGENILHIGQGSYNTVFKIKLYENSDEYYAFSMARIKTIIRIQGLMTHIRELILLQNLQLVEKKLNKTFHFVHPIKFCLNPIYNIITPYYPYSLRDIILDKVLLYSITLKNILYMIYDLIEVIELLHDKLPGGPFIHNDIRLSNIVLSKEKHKYLHNKYWFKAYLNDFNHGFLSHYFFDPQTDYPLLCGFCSPPSKNLLHSPEALGGRSITHFADIYGLCLVIFQLFSGNLYLHDHSDFYTYQLNANNFKMFLGTGQFLPVFTSNMPPEIVQILRKCFIRNPFNRPEAKHFKQIFDDIIYKYAKNNKTNIYKDYSLKKLLNTWQYPQAPIDNAYHANPRAFDDMFLGEDIMNLAFDPVDPDGM